MNTAYVLGCYLEDLVGDDRFRAWVPVAGHDEPPVDVTDNLWRGEYLEYEELVERLDELTAKRSA